MSGFKIDGVDINFSTGAARAILNSGYKINGTDLGITYPINNVAWPTLGTITGGFHLVNAIAVDSNNVVYIGGAFTTIGGVNVNYIVRWSTTNGWHGFGSAISYGSSNNDVRAIAIDSNNNVYVGGTFTTVAGISNRNNIIKWTPSTGTGGSWSALGTQPTGGTDGSVNAIAIDSANNVYIGGDFSTITANGNTIFASRIAKWTPITDTTGSWSALGTGTTDKVFAITIDSANNVYVGGGFTTAGSIFVSKIAKWTPITNQWSALGSGTNYDVYEIAIDSQNNNNVYVGGDFTTAGDIDVSRIAVWNGSTWSSLGTGINNTTSAIAFGKNTNKNVYIGGASNNVKYLPKTFSNKFLNNGGAAFLL